MLGGTNNYQYAPNPIGWIDPLGLVCKERYERYKALRAEGYSAQEATALSKARRVDDPDRLGVPNTRMGANDGPQLPTFANQKLLDEHVVKHGREFRVQSADEYLQIGQDIIQNGHKVEYFYKPADEMRTGYISFMRNKQKGGEALFGFVGTNSKGNITTIHTKSRIDVFDLIGDTSQSKLKIFRTDTVGPDPQLGWKYPYTTN